MFLLGSPVSLFLHWSVQILVSSIGGRITKFQLVSGSTVYSLCKICLLTFQTNLFEISGDVEGFLFGKRYGNLDRHMVRVELTRYCETAVTTKIRHGLY